MRSNPSRASILIVDNEPSVGDIISSRLTDEGHKCTVAYYGDSTLKKLDAYRFDLVLLDITLPGKSSIDILKIVEGGCRILGIRHSRYS